MDLFTDEIKQATTKYNVDPAIVKAIITQESAWQMFALRYEPNYRYLFQPEIYAKSAFISISTEVNTQKMSWGLGQIMGGLAREQGHKGLMGELFIPQNNINHICIRIAALKKKCDSPEEIFACYNGGLDALKLVNGKFRNDGYVGSAMGHLIKYQNS